MRIRMLAAALAVAAASAALTGCVHAETCVSWVDFETPQDAYDDAQLVVRGETHPTGATRDLFGAEAALYRVAVDEVLKGDLAADLVEVASTPPTCMGDAGTYPDGDPLDVTGEVILFLTDHEGTGVWRTITPFDGVLAVPDDGILPFEVADR